MLVSRGDVSCGEEKRGLSLRGEYGKLNRRIFKLASSIDSLQSAYIFNRHTSSIDISSIDISSIDISSGARCRVCGCKSGVHHGVTYYMVVTEVD
jgi:hypothetical protein